MRLIKVGYASLFALAMALAMVSMWISTQYGSSPISRIIVGSDGSVSMIENPHFRTLVILYPTILFLVFCAAFMVSQDKESVAVKALTRLSVKLNAKS